MTRTTLTANLTPLERRGPVSVAVDPDDRRSRRLRLTEDGRSLLVRAFPIWRKTHADVEADLAGNDADALRADLVALS